MLRLWGKLYRDNHIIRDTVYQEDSGDTRTHKIFRGLEQICYELDLGVPLWLDANIQEFQSHDKTRFCQDNFIESIPFDYLELQIIEDE